MAKKRALAIATTTTLLATTIGACGRGHEDGRKQIAVAAAAPVRSVSADLIAQEQLYTGDDLGVRELALTFDDGPGPASVTNDLSAYLKNRPGGAIHATFFVNGACIATTTLPNSSCGTPTPNAAGVMAQT